MRSVLRIDRARINGGLLPEPCRRYTLRPPRASLALRGLREVAWQAARAALLVGEAQPAAILDELRGLVGDLAARWAGLDRSEAMRRETRP
jgi:hypothetical protein